MYISLAYFKQKNVAGEIGSSTMPHKINPIAFENAEGNLGLSISLFTHFATKLPISRFQRDLSDSTVMRNLGQAFSFSLQSYKSLDSALNRITVNQEVLDKELHSHYELLAEPVQTVMRKYEGIKDPYEKLKEFTRGREITPEDYKNFIQSIEGMPQEEKDNLKKLTP
jgi:adenylosuccinate lyase